MSRVPYYLEEARTGYRLGHGQLVDGMYRDGFHCPLADQAMGATAENLAEQYGISREEQDRFSLQSHQRALDAIASVTELVETQMVGGFKNVMDRLLGGREQD